MRAVLFALATLLVITIVTTLVVSVQNRIQVNSMLNSAIQFNSNGTFPPLSGATEWLNSPSLTPASLRGKVVLVNFWTYTCINWLRQYPYVRAWADKYAQQGLVVIGVHTPEFSFEHDLDNVRREIAALGVAYPVAVDNGYAVWDAFANHYWPALYLIDAQGQVRYHRFGEGSYEETEMMIQQLLAEAGYAEVSRGLVTVNGSGVQAAPDWGNLRSPENYVGYDRTQNFASPGGEVLGKGRVYDLPSQLFLNAWALSGEWTMERGLVRLNQANGRIVYRFHARDLHMVMGPPVAGQSVRFRVLLDGQMPGGAHGADVDEQGNGEVTEQRLYQLIRQSSPIVDRQFEIEFLDAGVEAYSFTFG